MSELPTIQADFVAGDSSRTDATQPCTIHKVPFPTLRFGRARFEVTRVRRTLPSARSTRTLSSRQAAHSRDSLLRISAHGARAQVTVSEPRKSAQGNFTVYKVATTTTLAHFGKEVRPPFIHRT